MSQKLCHILVHASLVGVYQVIKEIQAMKGTHCDR